MYIVAQVLPKIDYKSDVELPVEIKRGVRAHNGRLSCTGTPTPQKPSHRPNGVEGVDAAEARHSPTTDFAIHFVQRSIHVEQQLAIG